MRTPLRALLVGGCLVLSACFGSEVQARKAARTAEAPVTILRVDTLRGYDEDGIEEIRHRVVWRFEADGQTYEDSLGATLYIAAEPYKVCYEPGDPTNSSIELADIPCSRSP